jgi:hypothetical protein
VISANTLNERTALLENGVRQGCFLPADIHQWEVPLEELALKRLMFIAVYGIIT